MRRAAPSLLLLLSVSCASRLLSPRELGAAEQDLGALKLPDLAPSQYSRVNTPLPGCTVAALAHADLDGDGRDDLAVGCGGASDTLRIELLFGRGDGSYAAGPSVVTPGHPSDIVIADVDGDGRPDVLTVASGSLLVIRNPGGGVWPATRTSWPGPATGLAVADLDEDGKLDVVMPLSSTSAKSIAWALGDGHGSFAAPASLALHDDDVYHVAARDFDGDGHVDFAVGTSSQTPHIDMCKGDGRGNFTLLTTVDIPNGNDHTDVLAAGDLDGDKLADVVVGSGALFRVVNHGGLNARPIGKIAALADAAIGDLDGDGRPDLAAVSATGLTLFVQAAGGNFDPPAFAADLPNALTVAIGDENGDHMNDLIIGSHDAIDVLLRRP